MVTKKPDSSVQNEQHREIDEYAEKPMNLEEISQAGDTVSENEERIEEESPVENIGSEEVKSSGKEVDLPEEITEKSGIETVDEAEHVEPVSEIAEVIDEISDKSEEEIINEASDDQHPVPESPEENQVKQEKIDYSALSREDLVDSLKDIIAKGLVLEVKDDVDLIKLHFYKKNKTEYDKQKKKFMDEGGLPEDFKPEEDPLETQLKEYLSKYRDFKTEYNKHLEVEKQKNLEEKYRIIEEIKDLVNRKESINKTFQEFRELQKRWRETGPVPQANLNDLWENYHHHIETFYDYIKINQELRDLDLKKNLESKIVLCEKAEELLIEPNVVISFNNLQALHNQWREIGPVPSDMRTEIWKRFKDATSKINKRHQEYFLNQKQEQKKNLEAKTVLCEKIEEINNTPIDSYTDWEKYTGEVFELQKVWRTIGFAPKKDNVKIFQRFREGCDSFFNRKREFISANKQEQDDNLQLKIELCIQAEALQDSTEWKKTTEELIDLQKKWKQIGPVPHKVSDKVWKRFRTACDKFFNRKSEFFSNIDSSYDENLRKKEELIAKVENFELSPIVEENLNMLKELQREWSNIGFVPYEVKDEIQEKFRDAVNKKFDAFKIDDDKKNIIKFKSKLESLSGKSHSDYRIHQERDKFLTKLKQLENDIVLWENNIGFFAKSKNAESMINEVQKKIDDAKHKIQMLTEKIKMIDDIED